MLRFQIIEDGEPAPQWKLRNAYLIGSDGSAMRAEIRFEDGAVICDKRETGAAALALQHEVGELGELTIQTCLLPERDAPYLLSVELARHRLMILYSKLEDWGLLELEADHPISKRAATARQLFIEALCVQRDDPAEADRLARQCLSTALDGTEELALAHSELLLNRRKTTHGLPSSPIGCGAAPAYMSERQRTALASNFDYLQLPICWKQLAPEEEGEYGWQTLDDWSDWAIKNKVRLFAGPLLSFEPASLPDWLYIWEHDYDTVRDLIYEHVERVVSRYRSVVTQWNVVSGLHVNKHFTFNFEQLMDLTRMTTMLVKKLAPSSKVIIELTQPFGEYYGSNPRSIPPMMYADLITQSGIPFDGLSLKLLMGQAVSGQFTRDLMQLSLLLDQYGVFGKPLFLTVGAPSEPVTEAMIAVGDDKQPIDPNSGRWRRDWSPQVQAHWLEAAFQIALSRPFVDAVAWTQMIDHPHIELPLSGIIDEQALPKSAFKRAVTFRRNLLAKGTTQHIDPDELDEGEAEDSGNVDKGGSVTFLRAGDDTD